MSEHMKTPVKVFYSYAISEQDEALRVQLEKHLNVLELSGQIAGWHKREIRGGRDWNREIISQLDAAQIILLLISPDFIASPYCYGVELKRAMERHERGEVRVIPILLRPVLYEGTPFAHLHMLPSNGIPISSWPNQDEAFREVARELSKTLADKSAVARASVSKAQEFVAATPKADILLVAATEVEVKAILSICGAEVGRPYTRRFIGNRTYYDLGSVGGAEVFLVQSEVGAGGPGGAILTVQEGILALSPSAVIMVGTAFGMHEGKQRIGDILVSRQILGYELQRIGLSPDGQMEIRVRGDRPHASIRLLDRFRSGLFDWQGARVQLGLILSGEKLVDHSGFREQLLKLEPEALGGEMEGAGLYAAAELNKVDWILVKAISDWANGTKAKNQKQRQQKAAHNAASFTMHIIKQGGFTKTEHSFSV